ncbi:MAG: hypothetical protein QGH33_00670 [Pirellulaceae bacterium]|jgi:hypothetical protein|nr:hypothetical protein [Pirellulaceae bacterium]HJN10659.1 hypothetical protein [Pirellulaceae bacterium]
MSLRWLTLVVVSLAVTVSVHAAEKEEKQAQGEPAGARGNVVGKLSCAKCDFKATEKCSTALKLAEKQFVLVSGKAGESLFASRCSGKLVRVSGVVTLKNDVATITGKKSTEVKRKNATPGLTLAGKLVCSKCDFKIGECAAALKAGDLQVVLDGDAAKELFKARCSGAPKVATGTLTKIDDNTVYLKVSKIADPKTRASDKKKPDATNAKKAT